MISIEKISDTFFNMIDDDGEILHTFERLGVLMDRDGNILYKWGSYQLVEHHFNEMCRKFISVGYAEYARSLVLLDISFLEQEEIDKILDICDYCGKIYNIHFKNGKKEYVEFK